MVARLDAQNAVDFRREADLESPNSIGADPFPQRFRGVAAATRGYAMLGGLGGLRRPLGSASRQGPGASIASLLLAGTEIAETAGLGRTPVTMAMFQQHGHPGSWM